MRLETYMNDESDYRGRIAVIVRNDGSSIAGQFIDELEENHPAEHKSLITRMRIHVSMGPSKNIQQSRVVKGKKYSGLLEFKTRGGARLVYFYQPGKTTVITNGFMKGAKPKVAYGRAIRIRDNYLREQQANDQ